MRKGRFRLIIVPESSAETLSQFECPYYLLSVLIVFAAIVLVAAAGLAYYFSRQYSEMRQQTAELPHLRKQVLQQKALIERSEETMREIRSHIAQLERAQKRLPVSEEYFEEFGPFFGMGGEEEDETQFEERSLQGFEDNAGAYFSLIQDTLQQQQQTTQDLEEYFDDQALQITSTPYLWPVPGFTRITSKFGVRSAHPVTGQDDVMHWGIDIGAPKGTPIVSTGDGIVIFSGEKGAFGKVIVIDHGSGYTTFYGHCSSLETQRGDRVKRGDTIARVGSSGRTTAKHLHYEIRVNGVAQNPLDFIAE